MTGATAKRRRPGRGAPGRRRIPREERKPEMLAAATRVFAARGFRGASMDAIAEAAGVTKPLLYSYFGPKEQLFIQCQRAATDELRGALREAADLEAPPDERLWHGLLALFGFIEEHRDAWLLYHSPQGGAPPAIQERAEAVRAEFTDLLADLLAGSARAEGVAEAATDQLPALSEALTGAAVNLANWWLARGEEPKELQVLRLMNLVWAGFSDLLEGRLWLPPAPR